ncbi:MAG: bifunctional (p)ppGpp synthetase/guanosine-3',5'-bis(diphosphate) 3'-pyrophosphohydrolase [Lactobacillus sp.]|jgi:GTP pyrophosphokinase|uniref:GTP diphosphokinase n=1 Tax=Lacticaseibacillus suilingensis TaxID=2799577 RepID=A0ABW4BHN9_9LACO|nr:bifunctional (p)ppGpp synthetase/guanosine-3',5'-bis(diphosphate) 3'-pyrophosphohydrolase [Lacticaseibacillus suilingensis]MCI1895227.1 bifunctional (p)ppGpp synthetase/guanosine-3',5'-bis(diphosphate) 3'-pyrophosphohydrolase [Lactobacillus sp.]MCI1917602.1 bifunctional (p)ppGpp synthetase/guanosine-3',5'-bis(diphosphate) 3'-pyrophosphohydrolase [Lactobacillus sp.]MCI1942449.1 bifunctional (p)ppGpp synthetase/guanosine-3',5'-bis(diphosphate) 3'-pyrophosphohydrolase [Lactobacillus sp.]MCI1973
MAEEPELTQDQVMAMCAKYMNEEHQAFVKKAYDFAAYVHKDQRRKSGEPYIIHPIQVAGILAELKMDPVTVASGYLHDVVEDTNITLGDIQEVFGKETAVIVDGLTKLSKVTYVAHKDELAENHRKMLLAMAKDMRVILVKLADRLHNMRTLMHLRPDKQRRIANETLEIYAPLADRLGISTIKWELEDLSLRYLNPQQYYRIAQLMKSKRTEREAYIANAITDIKKALADLNMHYEIYGRPKHIYSIYKKMRDKHKQFDELYDLLAVRVITQNIKDCYAVLGVIHTQWKPMPGRFKDYIAMPKANGYQSLHTTVIGPMGKPLEVQIRTEEMHHIAEFGVAAHWAYKEGQTSEVQYDKAGKQIDMFREILEIQDETSDAQDFMESVKGDIFTDRVYVFTPQGDVYELPKGSVPLDFAYMVHTEVGNHSVGAKVNGKIVPLNYQLKNGDIVEMLTNSNSKPSRDWVNLVFTSRSRNKIRRYFKQVDKGENSEKGREALEHTLQEMGYTPKDYMGNKPDMVDLLKRLNFATEDELLSAIGYGEYGSKVIANRLTDRSRREKADADKKAKEAAILANNQKVTTVSKEKKPVSRTEEGVVIEGVDNLLVHLAKCCNPVPGDPIVGYVTKGRGVTIHRADCPNIDASPAMAGRLIDVSWQNLNDQSQLFDTDIEIYGYNRSGLLNDVLQTLNAQTKNLTNVNGRVDHDKMADIHVTVGIPNLASLEHMMDAIKNIPDIYEVKRSQG